MNCGYKNQILWMIDMISIVMNEVNINAITVKKAGS